MAAILGIDAKSLQRLVREHKMPRTGYGLYPVSACVQWYIKYWQDKALGREGNNAKRTKEQYEALEAQDRYEETHGKLVNREAMGQVITAGFLKLGKWLDGLPSTVGRRHNLSAEVQRSIRAHLDEGRVELVKNWREFIDVVDDGKTTSQS